MKLLRRYLAWKLLRWVLLAGVLLLGLIQVVPYGRDHANPPVRTVLEWDSPRTEQLARGACLDCHSNLTRWPWYADVAPVSWLVAHDVGDGRGALNLSELDLRRDRGGESVVAEVVRMVRSGEMPPLQYKAVHGSARLSAAQRAQLAAGLQRTLEASGYR